MCSEECARGRRRASGGLRRRGSARVEGGGAIRTRRRWRRGIGGRREKIADIGEEGFRDGGVVPACIGS